MTITQFPNMVNGIRATYPFEDSTPFACSKNELENIRGNFGESLIGFNTKKNYLITLAYARTHI